MLVSVFCQFKHVYLAVDITHFYGAQSQYYCRVYFLVPTLSFFHSILQQCYIWTEIKSGCVEESRKIFCQNVFFHDN